MQVLIKLPERLTRRHWCRSLVSRRDLMRPPTLARIGQPLHRIQHTKRLLQRAAVCAFPADRVGHVCQPDTAPIADDEGVRHVRRRIAFGKPLAEFQMTQARIADMAVAIDATALLVYRAAWVRDQGAARITREAAMAKLAATESAQQVIDHALQLLGARGLVCGEPVERLYREIRALRIYEGTTEIQKIVIAGLLLHD